MTENKLTQCLCSAVNSVLIAPSHVAGSCCFAGRLNVCKRQLLPQDVTTRQSAILSTSSMEAANVSHEQLLAALRCNFNHEKFRNHQLEAIQATLSGKDSLLILSTGGGKSMTFQLPALAKGNCFTVIVGPLIALARDQVDACLDLGIDARVWNSDTSEDVRKQILSELVSDEPELRLLYTTPEALRNPSLRGYLKEAYEAGTLLSFAIDEAHCVSEWGHDFRPAYLELSTLKTDFPKTPIAALTASCTSTVEASIVRQLSMQEPLLIKGGFNRPNIQYQVEFKELLGGGSEDEVVEHLVQFIQARQGQCGIIYARLRATCDWLCSALSASDIDVGVYHAGKDGQKRRQVQRDWCEGGLEIVVATIAFGMGIDRADVRWVVHWDVPTSLEGFYQESGRAGRDGLPSESIMYVSADDLDTITRLEKANRAGAAAEVTSFACQPGCRRKKILNYFGQKRGPCAVGDGEQQCDYCRDSRAASRLQLQWEEQVQRKSVQLALKQQRQQMAAAAAGEEDSSLQQQGQDGSQTSVGAAGPAEQGSSRQRRPRIGQWGSAKAFTEPAAAYPTA
ncbi:P-loop containing nucleoside triphosphate hydrolase protein [Scenedesmus sp. NREL 46B-D3]|nr:P-loop containing nucleoside triphosphate hydrolase protein [Scenedesmus sp. NREL 46B-D3]